MMARQRTCPEASFLTTAASFADEPALGDGRDRYTW